VLLVLGFRALRPVPGGPGPGGRRPDLAAIAQRVTKVPEPWADRLWEIRLIPDQLVSTVLRET